jgi:hypothetical protein
VKLKKGLLRFALLAAWREALRTPRVPADAKVSALFLVGAVASPFVVVISGTSFIWWLITGKRLPGRIGQWVGPPSRLGGGVPKQLTELPPDIRAAMARWDSREPPRP